MLITITHKGEIDTSGRLPIRAEDAGHPFHGNQWTEETHGIKSPAFKKWFGESRVVDAEGKPLKVYHGSWRDFSNFNRLQEEKNRKGVKMDTVGSWFTSSADSAGKYGPATYPVYLSVQKPIVFEGDGKQGGTKAFRNHLIMEGGVEQFRKNAEDEGHDGVIIKNDNLDGLPGDVFIAFHPHQIKSTLNKGIWSKTDKNISARTDYSGIPLSASTADEVSQIVDALQKTGKLPPNLPVALKQKMQESLEKYYGKIADDKITQLTDAAAQVVKDTLTTYQEDRGDGATAEVGLNPATGRSMLSEFADSLIGETIGDTMGVDFFLKIAREVTQGGMQYASMNWDKERVDEFPAVELVRVYPVYTPRGEELVHGVPNTENGWDYRFPAACDDAGDDDALNVFNETGRMVALKDSDVWDSLGDGAGGYTDTLGNPFPPFAFSSGMDWNEVSRADAVALGLMDDDDDAAPAKVDFATLFDFADDLDARYASWKKALHAGGDYGHAGRPGQQGGSTPSQVANVPVDAPKNTNGIAPDAPIVPVGKIKDTIRSFWHGDIVEKRMMESIPDGSVPASYFGMILTKSSDRRSQIGTALHQYTTGDYQGINSHPDDPQSQYLVAGLKKLVPLNRSIPLVRGVSFPDEEKMNSFVGSLDSVGKSVRLDRTLTSFTTKQTIAEAFESGKYSDANGHGKYNVLLHLSNYKTARDISKWSDFGTQEREIVLLRGTTLKVDSVQSTPLEGGKHYDIFVHEE